MKVLMQLKLFRAINLREELNMYYYYRPSQSNNVSKNQQSFLSSLN